MVAIVELGGKRVLRYGTGDGLIDSERRASDLIGDALGEGIDVVVVPVDLLPVDFFQLRTGLAGVIAQKLVNYRITLAVLGDITDHLAASNALRDWVREANRSEEVWFLATDEELAARLAQR